MDANRSVTPEERRRALDVIAAEVAACTRCPLHATRTMAVPGEGHPETEVVFVGEGPGYNEDQQGRPFVGAAGSLLNVLLRQIGWRRQEVFITNVVKCRPPANRDPEPNEIEACAPYLKRQLEILDPAVVVTLGRHSLQTFNAGARIGGAHGTLRTVDPATGAPDAMTYAMYHPAAALRQGSLKQTMLEDMCGLPDALLESRRHRAGSAATEQAPAQAATPPQAPIDQPIAELVLEAPAEQEQDQEPVPVIDEPIALEVEPELVAVAIGLDPLAEPIPVDENQMSLF